MSVFTDNPAAVTGLIRALLILLVSFGVRISGAQVDAILNLSTALIVVVSLAMTVVTVKTTVPKTPSPSAGPASIQTPAPTDAAPSAVSGTGR